MVLLAAYKAMLFRYTGDTDIIVGGVTDTRRRPELQALMGYFLNTMALRSQPAATTPFRDYLAQVKRSVIGALGASDVPFDRLIRALDIKRGTGTHPLFEHPVLDRAAGRALPGRLGPDPDGCRRRRGEI